VRATQRDWVVHTGAQYPNRVDITTLNPLALYTLRPTPLGSDRVSLHAVLNSPFGNYDVDVANITMSVTGPTTPGQISPPRVVQRSFEHNHHYEPVELTWLWNYHLERAAPGTYTVTVTAPNLQHTASVTKTASFVIPEDGRAVGYDDAGAVVAPQGEDAREETPAPGIVLLVLAVLALALLRR
jgi:hypothetical protein